MTSRPIICHTSDRRTVGLVVVTLSTLSVPVASGTAVHGALALLFVPLAGLLCLSACASAHNQVHWPVFRSRGLNAALGLLTTLAMGHSATGIMLSHVYNHHVHIGTEHDWIRPGISGAGPNWIRWIRFVVRASRSMTLGARAAGAPRLSRSMQRRAQIERFTLYTVSLALAVASPRALFFFILPSWALGLVSFLVVNFLQHDDCLPRSRMHHSMNHRGKVMNWFFMNAGYHTAHHLRPDVHWSQLPELHDHLVAHRINPKYERGSILKHFIVDYLFGVKSIRQELQSLATQAVGESES